MAKSKIIKELVSGEATLEKVLCRIMVIASDLDNEELMVWAESELQGYKYDDVPSYRKTRTTSFVYSGINGSFQIKNNVFPHIHIIKKHIPDAFDISICDGISTIEDYVKSENSPIRDFTYLNGIIQKETGISCANLSQRIPLNFLQNILNRTKTIALKILLKLEKVYGCLDDMDIDITDVDMEEVEKTNTIINNYIFEDKSINIGDGNKINNTDVITGG